MATGVNQAMALARKAIQAGKAVYDFSKEGAQLQYVAGKFDNLTASIGTTSSALLNDLRTATQGTLSDAELIQTATDMMSLGLSETHDQTVRLSNAAGQLGMNMDQLTLTLTNQTTRRFDTLGISVTGFDEKLEKLKATGMDTQAAFTEAFLQQAEAQIARVGGIATTGAGQVMMMESAFKNLGDQIKLNFADALVGIAPVLTDVGNGLAENATKGREWSEVNRQLESAVKLGIVSGAEYNALLKDMGIHSGMGAVTTEQLAKATELYEKRVSGAAEKTNEWNASNYEGAEAILAVESAIASQVEAMEAFTLANTESVLAVTNLQGVYASMATDFDSMQKMAIGYDGALTLINESQARIAELEPFKETGGTLNGVKMSADEVREAIEALEGASSGASDAIDRMAAEMTLSMLQASMSIDGYTEGEIQSLLDFMVEAKLISQEAAEQMSADYAKAIETANRIELEQKIGEILADTSNYENGVSLVGGLLIDNKTGKVLADTKDYMDGLTQADLAKLPPEIGEILADIMPYLIALAGLPEPEPKTAVVGVKYEDPGFHPNVPSSVNIAVNYIPNVKETRALGGEVYPGKEYMWQEPGREGEVFIPETYGRVMSAHEVAMMVREAFSPFSGGSSKKVDSGQVPTSNKNVTYNINASYKGEPVLSLSEHLRILGTLEGVG
jgi:hypothetical protein